MKRIFLLTSILFYTFNYATAQGNFSIKIYAGSNAPWGESQFVSIDPKGVVKYDRSDVNTGIKDSLTFTITKAQLAQLHDAVNQVRFFTLNTVYNARSRDGTRLTVEVVAGGRTHRVSWLNIHTRETALILSRLNAIFRGRGITIQY